MTDELLTKRGPNELKKAIEVCKNAGIVPSEKLALMQPRELERKITKCKDGGLPIEASILEKSDEEIDEMISAADTDREDDFGDEWDGWDDASRDVWL